MCTSPCLGKGGEERGYGAGGPGHGAVFPGSGAGPPPRPISASAPEGAPPPADLDVTCLQPRLPCCSRLGPPNTPPVVSIHRRVKHGYPKYVILMLLNFSQNKMSATFFCTMLIREIICHLGDGILLKKLCFKHVLNPT